MHAYAAPPASEPESAVDLAFEHLYRRYVKDVYRYTLAVLRNPSDAEDVTQTTFLNAYRAFQRGEQPRKPQHWLIKIAHNACRTRYVRNARRPVEVPLDESLAHVPVPTGDEMDVEELLAALGELPFRQRAALVMRELDGRSYREIAETLEVTVPAVETLIFRARRRLRADRAALRGLAAVPLPPSLASFVGGGGGAVAGGGALLGTGFAFKVVLMLAAGIAAGGVATNGFKAIAAPTHPTRATALGERVRQPASVGGARSTALLTKTGVASTVFARRSAERGGATFAQGRAANLPPGAVHLGTISTAPRGGAAPPPPAGAEPGAGPAVAAPPAEPSAQPSSPASTPSAPTAPTTPSAPGAPTAPTTAPVSTATTTASQATTSPVPGVSPPAVPPAPTVPPPPTILDPVTSLLPPPPPLPKLP